MKRTCDSEKTAYRECWEYKNDPGLFSAILHPNEVLHVESRDSNLLSSQGHVLIYGAGYGLDIDEQAFNQ